ncbi:MAG: tetratricopeptide repeat protein, partial [Deltaproteobacteria bacterium]|nr:tetratricopeptide repeat protein [Deltaproteobacteria bacterium]
MDVERLPAAGSGRYAAANGPDDGWALLEGLRRRLDDQTSQARKTHQQVSQLTESIAALVELQRARTQRINLNSFIAYLIFTVLLGIGFYVLYNSRANELVEARDHADKERDTATRRADDLSQKAAARDIADTRAWEVFQLLEAGKRSEATGKLAALRDLRLSRTERAVLAARAHETQIMEVDAALKAATASFKAGRYADVIAPLEAALVGEPTGSRAAAMRYFLGIAYAKGGALDKAITYLQAALDADVEHDDARFQLASALDRSGAYAKARIEYDKFATAYPQSQFAVFAMRRSATLARMPANAPAPDPKADPHAPAGSAAPAPAPPVAKPVA